MEAPENDAASNDTADTPVWERQEGESARAYDAFCQYRDMGPERSLAKLSQNHTKSIPTYKALSVNHDWVARAEAYDKHIEQEQRARREAQHLEQITQYRDRQRRLATAATEASIKLLQIVNKKLTKLASTPDNEDDIKVSQLPGLLTAASGCGRVGAAAEAEALGIEELLKQFDDNAEDHS